MDNKELFQKVRDLNLPMGKYALFGSAPIGIRGLKKCHDVDIIVTKELWNQFEIKGWEIKAMPNGNKFLCNGDLELWENWGPGVWNIDDLIASSEIIDGLPFVKLEYVLDWKKKLGREKDLKDIQLIEEYLKTT